ncbi:hypothetical protein MASR2M64_09920 [Candidatus Cloacimonadota bacterium]
MEAPMLPDNPTLVKCPHCGALLWIYDQKVITNVDPWLGYFSGSKEDIFKDTSHFKGFMERDETKKNIPKCLVVPSFEDYIEKQKDEDLRLDKRLYVIQRAWWAGNNIRRNSLVEIEYSKAETANLEQLAILLDVTNEDHCMILVEVYRELGRFAEAESVLLAQYEAYYKKNNLTDDKLTSIYIQAKQLIVEYWESMGPGIIEEHRNRHRKTYEEAELRGNPEELEALDLATGLYKDLSWLVRNRIINHIQYMKVFQILIEKKDPFVREVAFDSFHKQFVNPCNQASRMHWY